MQLNISIHKSDDIGGRWLYVDGRRFGPFATHAELARRLAEEVTATLDAERAFEVEVASR